MTQNLNSKSKKIESAGAERRDPFYAPLWQNPTFEEYLNNHVSRGLHELTAQMFEYAWALGRLEGMRQAARASIIPEEVQDADQS